MSQKSKDLPPNAGLGTRAVHAGELHRNPHDAITTPIVSTATYVFADTAGPARLLRGPVRARGVRPLRQPHRARRRAQAGRPGGAPRRRCSPAAWPAVTTTLLALLKAGRPRGDDLGLLPAHAAVRRRPSSPASASPPPWSSRATAPALERALRAGQDQGHPVRVADQPVPARGRHAQAGGRDQAALRRRQAGHRRHLRHAHQPAPAGARRRPGHPLVHQVPGRPQRPAGRRRCAATRGWSAPSASCAACWARCSIRTALTCCCAG